MIIVIIVLSYKKHVGKNILKNSKNEPMGKFIYLMGMEKLGRHCEYA